MSNAVGADQEAAIREICDLYNLAEADLKAVGRIRNELVVASVNQLRYAGQHLVRALAAEDDAVVAYELDASKRHAQRAIYDVNDAAIQFYMYEIERFRTQHPVNLNAVIPDYAEIIESVDRAHKHIREIEHANRRNRGMSYERARADVVALECAHRKLVTARPDVIAEMNRQNRVTRTTWLSIFLTVLAVLIGFPSWIDN